MAVVFLVLLACLLAASAASATFHEMSIREIYPGSAALPDSEYIELQMWAPGQNFVAGHSLKTYSETGASTVTTTFAADVPGGANQSTILIATPAAETQFGVTPDAAMKPGQLSPTGGGACWAESLDCVSWGNFSGSLPGAAGSPAAPGGIPDEMALRRTIAPGCATLLEPTDDRDNSAVDFAVVFPAPRPNAVPPSEHACASPGGSGGAGNGGPGRGAPQTIFKAKPPHRTHDRTPTFRFQADEPGSSFQCKLDDKRFRRCHSPLTTPRLAAGGHVFLVRARDDSGKLDPSPARYRFRVLGAR